MKRLLIASSLLICCSLAAAQTAAPAATKKAGTSAPKTAAQRPTPAAMGDGNEPVITVAPPCPAPKPGAAKSCKNTVTQSEFEAIVKAAGPNMAPAMRRNFANNVARMLSYSNEAARMGLQNTPEGREMLEISRIQAMAQLLGRKLQSEAANVPPGEIQTYYRENQKKFRSATLERLLIPKKAGEDEKAQMEFAEQLRTRWAAGEDATKLQKEGFQHVGNNSEPPPVAIGERRIGSLPTTHDAVFDLNPGEISKPIVDPNAIYIYKVVSKADVPLEKAEEEIKRTLGGKRLEDMVKALDARAPVTLNDAYFKSLEATQPSAPPTPGSAPEPVKKPVAPKTQTPPPAAPPQPATDKPSQEPK